MQRLLDNSLQALVSGIISLLAFYYHEQVDSYFEYDNPTVYYSGLSAVMSFLLVFRGNMAYSRYWEGRTALQDMTSRLEDLGIHINSFIISEEKEAMEWKERMGANVSVNNNSRRMGDSAD
jgi:predicted membrane chloride channel (bestrophin family)